MINTETAERAQRFAEVLPADQLPRVVGFTSALNRYEVHDWRYQAARGIAVAYGADSETDGSASYVVWRSDFADPGTRAYRDATDAYYLIDNGRAVVPCYVAGYGPASDRDMVILHPIRVRQNSDLVSPMAPRRAFHLVLRWLPTLDDWHTARYGTTSDNDSVLRHLRTSRG